MNLYFKEIKKEILKNFPGSKFIILIYDYKGIDNELKIKELGMNEIADKVIILNDIVDIDLTSSKYKIDDNLHPNAEAWQIIVPELVKELEL